MWFSRQEIATAMTLKKMGLQWIPRAGHYVWDAHDSIRPTSPFQRGVFFLLDLECFVQYFGSLDEVKERLVWLPTWEQCRAVLQQSGISNEQVAARLYRQSTVDRLTLYHMLAEVLRKNTSGSVALKADQR